MKKGCHAFCFLVSVLISINTSSCFAQKKGSDDITKDTLYVIHARKSVRNYTGEPVNKTQLETLVKAGMAAPSAMDKRPWAFIIITDKKTLETLAEGSPYSRMIVSAGAAIVVCGLMDKTVDGPAQEFWVQDCSAATENILLAAEHMGLGAVWTGMYPIQERMQYVQKTLGIPANVIPLNIIAVGYPTGVDQPKNKFDQSAIHWDKW